MFKNKKDKDMSLPQDVQEEINIKVMQYSYKVYLENRQVPPYMMAESVNDYRADLEEEARNKQAAQQVKIWSCMKGGCSI